VPVDDALDDCQSDPNAREFGTSMQALKGAILMFEVGRTWGESFRKRFKE